MGNCTKYLFFPFPVSSQKKYILFFFHYSSLPCARHYAEHFVYFISHDSYDFVKNVYSVLRMKSLGHRKWKWLEGGQLKINLRFKPTFPNSKPRFLSTTLDFFLLLWFLKWEVNLPEKEKKLPGNTQGYGLCPSSTDESRNISVFKIKTETTPPSRRVWWVCR